MKLRSEAPRSVVLAAIGMSIPVVVLAAAGAAVEQFDMMSTAVLTIVVIGTAVAAGAGHRTAATLTLDDRAVVLGLRPFWRTRLALEDLRQVDVIAVDGHARWVGWGIKGRADREPGLLYSVGGRHGVRVVTFDGRRSAPVWWSCTASFDLGLGLGSASGFAQAREEARG